MTKLKFVEIFYIKYSRDQGTNTGIMTTLYDDKILNNKKIIAFFSGGRELIAFNRQYQIYDQLMFTGSVRGPAFLVHLKVSQGTAIKSVLIGTREGPRGISSDIEVVGPSNVYIPSNV